MKEVYVRSADSKVHRAAMDEGDRVYTTASCTGMSSGVKIVSEDEAMELDPEVACAFCWPELNDVFASVRRVGT